MTQEQSQVKDYLKQEKVADRAKDKISEAVATNGKAQQALSEAQKKSPAEDTMKNDNLTIPAYDEALTYFDRQFHQFEHNFIPNVNKYPNSQLDQKSAVDNNPEYAEMKDIPTPEIIHEEKNKPDIKQ